MNVGARHGEVGTTANVAIDLSEGSADQSAPRLTRRGAATRARIVRAAAELIQSQGVGRTTVDEVIAMSAASKSQFYRHFDDKAALVLSVIDLVGAETMQVERKRLSDVNDLADLRRWRDTMVASHDGRYDCPLATLVADLSDEDAVACQKLNDVFHIWRGLFESLFLRFSEQGMIPVGANIAQIASGFVVAVQGGCLLARTAGDIQHLASALDLCIEHVQMLGQRDS